MKRNLVFGALALVLALVLAAAGLSTPAFAAEYPTLIKIGDFTPADGKYYKIEGVMTGGMQINGWSVKETPLDTAPETGISYLHWDSANRVLTINNDGLPTGYNDKNPDLTYAGEDLTIKILGSDGFSFNNIYGDYAAFGGGATDIAYAPGNLTIDAGGGSINAGEIWLKCNMTLEIKNAAGITAHGTTVQHPDTDPETWGLSSSALIKLHATGDITISGGPAGRPYGVRAACLNVISDKNITITGTNGRAVWAAGEVSMKAQSGAITLNNTVTTDPALYVGAGKAGGSVTLTAKELTLSSAKGSAVAVEGRTALLESVGDLTLTGGADDHPLVIVKGGNLTLDAGGARRHILEGHRPQTPSALNLTGVGQAVACVAADDGTVGTVKLKAWGPMTVMGKSADKPAIEVTGELTLETLNSDGNTVLTPFDLGGAMTLAGGSSTLIDCTGDVQILSGGALTANCDNKSTSSTPVLHVKQGSLDIVSEGEIKFTPPKNFNLAYAAVVTGTGAGQGNLSIATTEGSDKSISIPGALKCDGNVTLSSDGWLTIKAYIGTSDANSAAIRFGKKAVIFSNKKIELAATTTGNKDLPVLAGGAWGGGSTEVTASVTSTGIMNLNHSADRALAGNPAILVNGTVELKAAGIQIGEVGATPDPPTRLPYGVKCYGLKAEADGHLAIQGGVYITTYNRPVELTASGSITVTGNGIYSRAQVVLKAVYGVKVSNDYILAGSGGDPVNPAVITAGMAGSSTVHGVRIISNDDVTLTGAATGDGVDGVYAPQGDIVIESLKGGAMGGSSGGSITVTAGAYALHAEGGAVTVRSQKDVTMSANTGDVAKATRNAAVSAKKDVTIASETGAITVSSRIGDGVGSSGGNLTLTALNSISVEGAAAWGDNSMDGAGTSAYALSGRGVTVRSDTGDITARVGGGSGSAKGSGVVSAAGAEDDPGFVILSAPNGKLIQQSEGGASSLVADIRLTDESVFDSTASVTPSVLWGKYVVLEGTLDVGDGNVLDYSKNWLSIPGLKHNCFVDISGLSSNYGGRARDPSDPTVYAIPAGAFKFNGLDIFRVTLDANGGELPGRPHAVQFPVYVKLDQHGVVETSYLIGQGQECEPEPATRQGWTCDGWYTGKTGGAPWDFYTDKVTGDLTLYAHWRQGVDPSAKFTVAFDTRTMGSVSAPTMVSQEIPAFGYVTEPHGVTAATGHTLLGWYTASGTKWDFDLMTVSNDLTLYVKTAELKKVTFDSKAPAASVLPNVENLPEPVYVAAGSVAAAPENPTLEGYNLKGWYTEAGTRWDFAANPVLADMTLYAHWDSEKVTVTFSSYGSSANQEIKRGETARAPDGAPRKGYAFAGWSSTRGGQVDYVKDSFIGPLTESLTFYGVYAPYDLELREQALPAGSVGTEYTVKLDGRFVAAGAIPFGIQDANGGSARYVFQLTGGNLPAGAALDEATGELRFTPAKAGEYRFTARVIDTVEARRDAEREYTVAVAAGQALDSPAKPAWDASVPAKATWDAVADASSYEVQLYKNSVKEGNAVTAADPAYDFTDAIAAAGAGSYTFTVTALSGAADKADSAPSAQSAAYAYNPYTVTEVTVAPDTASVAKGGTRRFAATVSGTGNPPQAVEWSVTGSTNAGTVISDQGVLTVAADETETSLTVTATAKDTSVSGTAVITVTDGGEPETPVKEIQASPGTYSFGSLTAGYTQPAAATIYIHNLSTGSEDALTLAAPTSRDYDVSLSGTELTANGFVTLTIRPKAGLPAGDYNETIKVHVSGDTNVSTSVEVSFTVAAAPNNFKVTLVYQDGSTGIQHLWTDAAGKLTADLPTPTRANHTFNGWFDAAGGGSKIENGHTFVQDATLYAQWTAEQTGSIGGGGGGNAYSKRTITDKPTQVSVSGMISASATLTVEKDGFHKAGDAGCDLLRSAQKMGNILSIYSTALKGDFEGQLQLSLPVSSCDDTPLTVVHCLNGKLSFYDAMVRDGFVSVQVDDGGVFAVMDGLFGPDLGTKLPFTDVSADHWFHEYVLYVYRNGIMEGTSADKFSPNLTTTRAMMATLLWRMEGSPAAAGSNPFTDVAAGQWYTEAVLWAAEKDLVAGYGDGLFKPNEPITRQQLAVLLYRYAKFKGLDVSVGENTNILSYADAHEIDAYAMPAMQWACGAQILQGKSGNLLSPAGSATRAEVAAVLTRFHSML